MIGYRVRLKHEVLRFPHFVAPMGATGTVVDVGDPHIFAVRLDAAIVGAEDWLNEIHWTNGDDPGHDLDIICADCGRTFEGHDTGRCDSCDTQRGYDRASAPSRRRIVIDVYDHTPADEVDEIVETLRGIGLDNVSVEVTT